MEKLFVIKIGGNVIDNEDALTNFLSDFATINGNKILVHGGGKLATQLAEKMGVQQQMVDGRRITDAETLKIVTMVYAGLINKNIVAKLQLQNCNAVGLSGADGNALQAHKRVNAQIDYGFAGDLDEVNDSFFHLLISNGYCPVVSPITHDKKGQLLNTNADTIAQEIAVGLSKRYDVSLIYSFEKKGVLSDAENDDAVIEKINAETFEQLKNDGVVSGGMIPKLTNALHAVGNGVKNVTIGHASELAGLCKQEAGTTIYHEQ